VAIECVDLHQFVQKVRIVWPQLEGLQEGFQSAMVVLQFLALQTTDLAEILEALVGRDVALQEPANLLDERRRAFVSASASRATARSGATSSAFMKASAAASALRSAR